MKKIEDIKKTKNLFINEEGVDGFCGRYYDSNSGKWLNFVFSYYEWEHLSVSMPNKTPSWDQMCEMKNIFWEENEVCVQYHPRKKDYVNVHHHCLHIWRPIKEQLPTPPTIFV